MKISGRLCFALITIMLAASSILAEESLRAGISPRVDPALSSSGDVIIELNWDEGAIDTSLFLRAPLGVELRLPDGRTLTAGEHGTFGSVSPGEIWLLEISGLSKGNNAFLSAERIMGEERFQSVIDFGIQDEKAVLIDIRNYLVRPAAQSDFHPQPAEFETGDIEAPENTVRADTPFNAIIIETLSPKIGATVFAEDGTDRAIDDGPGDCQDSGGTWPLASLLYVDSAPADAVSTAITVHVEITHPVMADLQVAFGHTDNIYTTVWLNYLVKDDAGVDLNRNFTRDRYNNNFMALGDHVNGYYELTVRDCAAGDTGTLTYYSVLVEYGDPTTIDLLADNVHVSPDTVEPGDGATVSWSGHVEGTGTVSGAFNATLYLSNDTNITSGDTWLATINVGSATNPGDSFGETSPGHSVTIPPGLSDGTYYIGAIIDSSNTIAESNESNNVAWDGFQVETAADEYDLVADSFTPQSGSVQAGENVAVNWFGHLSGTSTGNVTNSFTVGFYLSADGSITGGDTLLTRTTIAGPLAPGASIGTSGLNLTIPGGTSAGSYFRTLWQATAA